MALEPGLETLRPDCPHTLDEYFEASSKRYCYRFGVLVLESGNLALVDRKGHTIHWIGPPSSFPQLPASILGFEASASALQTRLKEEESKLNLTATLTLADLLGD